MSRIPLGAHDAPLNPLVGWGGGVALPIPEPLDSFGVSIFSAFSALRLEVGPPHFSDERVMPLTVIQRMDMQNRQERGNHR